MAPKATSSPSISEEQKERMIRNRKLAEERRLARLKNTSNVTNNTENDTVFNTNPVEVTNNVTIDIRDTDDININKKHNRSNIIDSSDDEDGITMVNESITVDIHTDVNMQTHSRYKNKEINRNEDFDSILIDDNDKTDKTTSKDIDDINKQSLNEPNNVSEETDSEIDNIKDQSKQRQNNICEIDKESIRNDENTKDVDNKITDNKESNLEKNIKTVENPVISKESAENVNNEEINSQVDSTKDANDDLMDVDFSEDF